MKHQILAINIERLKKMTKIWKNIKRLKKNDQNMKKYLKSEEKWPIYEKKPIHITT